MSGSINLIDVPYGRTAQEKIGNLAFGPTGQTISRMVTDLMEEKKAAPTTPLDSLLDTATETSPTVKQLVNLWKALREDTSDFDSRQRRRYELTVGDLWYKAFGFRALSESKQRQQVNAILKMQEMENQVKDRAVQKLLEEDYDGAADELQEWNYRWPEAEITIGDLKERLKSRTEAREKPIVERSLEGATKNVRRIFGHESEKARSRSRRR